MTAEPFVMNNSTYCLIDGVVKAMYDYDAYIVICF